MFGLRIASLSAAVFAITATSALAAPVVFHEIQLGDPNGGVNCGDGRRSLSAGLSTIAEVDFNSVGPNAVCTGSASAPPLTNFGELNDLFPGPISTSLGDVSFSAGDDDADVVSGRQGGQSGMPWADSSPYLVIAGIGDGTSGAVTFDLSNTSSNFFGLYWGSIDTYNTITFNMSDNTSQAFTGTQIIGGIEADGNQFDVNSNAYIGWLTLGATFDSVTLSTTRRAIEVDNFAFGTIAVPTPGALALMGFGLLSLVARRRAA